MSGVLRNSGHPRSYTRDDQRILTLELLRVLIALIVIAVGIGAFMLLQGVHG